MHSEYGSKHMLQDSGCSDYWLDTKEREMHGPWNVPVVKSLMWIFFFPCSCFLLEAVTKKKKISKHGAVCLFSNNSMHLRWSEEEMEFPKTSAE